MKFLRPQLAKSSTPKLLKEIEGSPLYVSEMKLDGHRLLISKQNAWSRLGKEIPNLSHIQDHIPDGWLLDGELIPKIGMREGSEKVSHLRAENPDLLDLVVFDVLCREHQMVTDLPWSERRNIIESLPLSNSIRLSVIYPMISYKTEDLMDLASQRGHEGIMLKKVTEPYKENSRSAWIKHKFTDTHDVVIVDANAKPSEWRVRPGEIGTDGILYPEGRHSDPWLAGHVGLNYGYYDQHGSLRIVGSLGETGPHEIMTTHIGKVAEVKGYGLYPTGAIRHPVFLRWREDKLPTDCVFIF